MFFSTEAGVYGAFALCGKVFLNFEHLIRLSQWISLIVGPSGSLLHTDNDVAAWIVLGSFNNFALNNSIPSFLTVKCVLSEIK